MATVTVTFSKSCGWQQPSSIHVKRHYRKNKASLTCHRSPYHTVSTKTQKNPTVEQFYEMS